MTEHATEALARLVAGLVKRARAAYGRPPKPVRAAIGYVVFLGAVSFALMLRDSPLIDGYHVICELGPVRFAKEALPSFFTVFSIFGLSLVSVARRGLKGLCRTGVLTLLMSALTLAVCLDAGLGTNPDYPNGLDARLLLIVPALMLVIGRIAPRLGAMFSTGEFCLALVLASVMSDLVAPLNLQPEGWHVVPGAKGFTDFLALHLLWISLAWAWVHRRGVAAQARRRPF